MREKQSGKSSRARFLIGMQIAGVAIAVLLLFLILKPSGDVTYRFMTADHPIDVMTDRTGRWFYYSQWPKGATPQLAANVRKELLPLGFAEDTTNKPWFRFVKRKREVIVCNHDEIATTPSLTNGQVFHETPIGTSGKVLDPVLWVHQPGSDMAGVLGFQVKKLALRW